MINLFMLCRTGPCRYDDVFIRSLSSNDRRCHQGFVPTRAAVARDLGAVARDLHRKHCKYLCFVNESLATATTVAAVARDSFQTRAAVVRNLGAVAWDLERKRCKYLCFVDEWSYVYLL